jgi:5-methylcytosine-specific restriction endonuclease McrA
MNTGQISLDHAIAKARGGTNLLHNHVIACKPCNLAKGSQAMSDFKPNVASDYLMALERHIADAIRSTVDVPPAAG